MRARIKGDIEAVFSHSSVKVTETPDRDYRFRAYVPGSMVGIALSERIRDIDYPNFKDSVPERWRHDLYARFWSIMFAAQTTSMRQETYKAERAGPIRKCRNARGKKAQRLPC